MKMQQSLIPGRPQWTFGPLYDLLVEGFPDYRTRRGFFDVKRFHKELGKSHEAVYKWLRVNKLTPENATKIAALATALPNLEALEKLGRTPPTVQDFSPFVFC
jgi:hypothetical protein